MADLYVPTHPVRLVTASSLFDGHDASINIMRRIFQSQGCEVIHLGHNRSVQEVVDAAIEEDVQGIAVSSYQGGHVEYFEYLVESLRERGAGHVQVVGGGGGVIVHDEIVRLRASGVTIFSPEDGQRLGLAGVISTVVQSCDVDLWQQRQVNAEQVLSGDRTAIARAITGAEQGRLDEGLLATVREAAARSTAPALGITGTGGSGKSSLTDEIVRRFRVHGNIEPARRSVVERFSINEQHMLPIVQLSGLIPAGHHHIFSIGFARLWQGDYVTAGHLLFPQVENSLRHLLKLHGHDSSKIEEDGIEGDRSLSVLLTTFRRQLEAILGEKLVWEMDSLLNFRPGPALRNELAHGKMHWNRFFSDEAIMACWLIYLLVILPIRPHWETHVAPALRSMSSSSQI